MPAHKITHIDPDSLASNPRANLAAWLRYESYILAAYRQHPRPYMFRPSNMSANSVCSKMRDAIRGGIAFSFCDRVSAEDLKKWWSETTIKVRGDTVIIGPPTKDGVSPIEDYSAPSSVSPTLHFPTLSFDELNAFHLLISHALLPGGVIVDNIPDPDLAALPSRGNVEVVQRDGKTILL